LLVVHHFQPHGRADSGDSGQLCEFTLISPLHHLLPPPVVIFAFCQPPWVPRVRRFGSSRRLSVLYVYPGASGGSLAGGGEAQEAACGGSTKLRTLRFCRVCQAPCSPCAYRIARSRRSAVPYTAWTRRRPRTRYRAAARNEWQFAAVAKLRLSRGCECAGNRPLHTLKNKNKCSASGAPESCSPYLPPPRSPGTAHNFRLLDRGLNIVAHRSRAPEAQAAAAPFLAF
jgi:hypothetical protein